MSTDETSFVFGPEVLTEEGDPRGLEVQGRYCPDPGWLRGAYFALKYEKKTPQSSEDIAGTAEAFALLMDLFSMPDGVHRLREIRAYFGTPENPAGKDA